MIEKNICIHCESKITDESLINDGFCCFGCKSAYAIINKIGLGNYYKFRQNNPDIRKIKPEIEEKIDLTNFITQDEKGNNELFLAIDGLHCAACVWLIENILKKQNDVVLARINLSKKYLNLKWRGSVQKGNEFVDLIREIGYKLFPFDEKILAEEEKKYNDELIKCLAVAGFGVGNVMLFSIILWFYDISEIGEKMRDFLHFFSALIALPVIVYAARPFFHSAFRSIKMRSANMDVAISVAIFLASSNSLIQTFRGADQIYFDSALMLCFFLLIGRYLDFKARKKTFDVAREFSLLTSNFARIIDGDQIKIIASKDVTKDMILLVCAGDKVAADGVVIDGESEIDASIITGESLPKKVFVGEKLFAGMININNALRIKVLQNQQNSMIAQISKIVEEVENHKNKYVNLADKLSKIYVPLVHFLAFATFVFWYFFAKSNAETALLNAIAVLVITCPCALALAVPITQTLTISSLIKRGILVKSGEAIEKINNVDLFIFDKTGTLTYGRPELAEIEVYDKNSGDKIAVDEEKQFYLKLAASMTDNSSHPISKAISASFSGARFKLEVQENKGFGLVSKYENHEIKLGRKTFMKNAANLENNGDFNITYLEFRDKIVSFYLKDKLKEDAKLLMSKLDKKTILLSGDNKNIVTKTALDLGIKEFYYEQTPLQKIAIVEKLKAQNHKIAFVGDGVNDTACLALADVSISFSRGAEISKNTAEIIIQSEKLMPISELLKLSKKSILLIKQNLFLALCYNFIAVPFAVFGYVSPLFAAIAMSSSSILVVLNSLRILKIKA